MRQWLRQAQPERIWYLNEQDWGLAQTPDFCAIAGTRQSKNLTRMDSKVLTRMFYGVPCCPG